MILENVYMLVIHISVTRHDIFEFLTERHFYMNHDNNFIFTRHEYVYDEQQLVK